MLDVHDQLAFVNIKDSTDKEVYVKTVKYPVKLNQEYLLGFAVRDRLMNVALDRRLLSLEEAVLKLDEADQLCVLFRDTTSDQLSLLFRRRDGSFSLLEPQLKRLLRRVGDEQL